MIRLIIDEIEVEVAEGSTLLEAADAANVYIPRLCSHPDLPAIRPEDLAPWDVVYQGPDSEILSTASGDGNDGQWSGSYEGCQLCLVVIEGHDEPVRSCLTVADDGMRISTSSPLIEERRRAKLKKIFSTHPHACVQCAQKAGCALEPCSTNVAKEERCCPIFHLCELRRIAEFVGIPDDTERYRPENLAIVENEPLFLRDHNLCIGCLRCVRMCREVRKVDSLGFIINRDGDPVVGTKQPTLKDSGCRFCMSCVEVCPTGSLRLKFEETRIDRDRVTRCLGSCPAGMDVPRYLREIRRGEFARAEAVIREAAPLPRVLGQVCFHPCEEDCLRADLSEPIAICSCKRAATDHMDAALWKAHLEPRADTGKKVAVVGAGPAGLTAAWFLRLKGHGVVLFEAGVALGGWLRTGIPAFRLAPEALDADVEAILGLGIEVRTEVEIGTDLSLEQIRVDHDAVFLAVGARQSKRLPCEGADLPGVESGLGLLEALATGDHANDRPLANEKVTIIGGGNVAIDVARSAVRLGPAEVHLYCLETREEMPAYGWEIDEAERDGIVIHPGWGPSLIAGEGRVSRVDFRKCVSVHGNDGRVAPEFDHSVTTSQNTDRVLVAIGQETAFGFLSGKTVIDRSPTGSIETDADEMQTSLDGVFAGGEAVSGPASVIDAIAHGRRAASGIDRYLGGDGNIEFQLLDDTELDGELGQIQSFYDSERVPMPSLPLEEATTCFDLAERGYSREQAMFEAERCLRCDLRLSIRSAPTPPESWLEFNEESVSSTPESAGVYQLLDEARDVYAIKGVDNLKAALTDILPTSTKARYFLYDEDPMYSKRESELIQGYLQKHGGMPPGEGDDDLDDLF